MSKPTEKSFIVFVVFALTFSILLVFWQVRSFDFTNYDDNSYVYQNPHVLTGLSINNIIWAFTSGHAFNWHPLTWLSLMLDCQFFGTDPGWMHLVNVFLHVANALLLFAFLKKITNALWPSAFVAALFALHPMHVESVAWITERKDVLSTLFLMLTLIAYISYVKDRGLLRYFLALLLFSLGLLAKPMLVTLPFLLLLLDYWPLNRIEKPASVIIEKIPFFILSGISAIVTFLVQQHGGSVIDINILSFQDRIANAFLSYVRYIGKMLWPQNLAVFYPYDIAGLSVLHIVLCALLLIGISVLVILFRRRHRYLPVGWFWFLLTLIPVIGLVQVGLQAMADRYTYIPYIGLFIIIAWVLSEILSKRPYQKLFLAFSALIVLMILAIIAHRQVSYWKNAYTLSAHAISVTQKNYMAYNNLGVACAELGRYDEAINAYEQAMQLAPAYADPYNNLSTVFARLGRYQDAIKLLEQAIQINPSFADAYYNLGLSYQKLGRNREGVQAFRQVIRINPGNAKAYEILGSLYYNLGQYKVAMETFQQAIRTDPQYAEAYNDLGAVYGSLGRYQDALDAFRRAILLKPDYSEAYVNSATTYGRLGLHEKEAQSYLQAILYDRGNAELYNRLGASYVKLGRYQDAIDAFKEALRIKPDYSDAKKNIEFAYRKLAESPEPIIKTKRN